MGKGAKFLKQKWRLGERRLWERRNEYTSPKQTSRAVKYIEANIPLKDGLIRKQPLPEYDPYTSTRRQTLLNEFFVKVQDGIHQKLYSYKAAPFLMLKFASIAYVNCVFGQGPLLCALILND